MRIFKFMREDAGIIIIIATALLFDVLAVLVLLAK
jgi:hypothetical protein